MHAKMKEYVVKQIDEASTFVLKNMPVNLTTDQVYEGLVGEEHVLRVFRETAQWVLPTSTHKRVDMIYGNALLKAQLRLHPTEKYPAFFMPKYNLNITPQSELGRALALPVRVATEWEMLKRTWERMSLHIEDVEILAFTFPWLCEIFLDFIPLKFGTLPKAEMRQMVQEVKLIVQGRTPGRFPFLTDKLEEVCNSGKRLFSQFRMLEATHKETHTSITVDRFGVSMPEWFERHLGEVIDDWTNEQAWKVGQ